MNILNQPFIKQWTHFSKYIQEPIQAFTELNSKAIQSFSYITPDELTNIKKTEDLLEKQVNILIKNAHNHLDYMNKSFDIVEKMVISMYDQRKGWETSQHDYSDNAKKMDESSFCPSSNGSNARLNPSTTSKTNPLHVSKQIQEPLVDHTIHIPESDKKIKSKIKASSKNKV